MVATQSVEPTPAFNERCRHVMFQWQAGEMPYAEAADALAQMAEEAVEQKHMANLARVEFTLGYIQGYRTNLNTAIRHFRRARELFEQVGNEQRVTSCDLNLGEVYRQKGDFGRARELFHTAYEQAGRLEDLPAQTVACANEGQMLLSMGQFEKAQMALNEALQMADRWPEDRKEDLIGLFCEIYHGLAVVYLNDGDLEAAWSEAKRALSAANATKQPLDVGQANRTMGEVLTALELPPEDAEFSTEPDRYFRASIEAFKELDSEGEMARSMHVYARSLAKRGRRVPAARQLQQAMLIFAKLGMVDDQAKAAETQTEIF